VKVKANEACGAGKENFLDVDAAIVACAEAAEIVELLNVDETGHKDDRRRLWTWCFRASLYTVFKISPSRLFSERSPSATTSKGFFSFGDNDLGRTCGSADSVQIADVKRLGGGLIHRNSFLSQRLRSSNPAASFAASADLAYHRRHVGATTFVGLAADHFVTAGQHAPQRDDTPRKLTTLVRMNSLPYNLHTCIRRGGAKGFFVWLT